MRVENKSKGGVQITGSSSSVHVRAVGDGFDDHPMPSPIDQADDPKSPRAAL
jgi:hypothetical protein